MVIVTPNSTNFVTRFIATATDGRELAGHLWFYARRNRKIREHLYISVSAFFPAIRQRTQLGLVLAWL